MKQIILSFTLILMGLTAFAQLPPIHRDWPHDIKVDTASFGDYIYNPVSGDDYHTGDTVEPQRGGIVLPYQEPNVKDTPTTEPPTRETDGSPWGLSIDTPTTDPPVPPGFEVVDYRMNGLPLYRGYKGYFIRNKELHYTNCYQCNN